MRDLCLLYGEEFYRAWAHSYEAVSSATSGFEIAYGKSLYEHLGENPNTAERFQRAMNSGSLFLGRVSDVFDFSEKTIVDVGGGGGHLLASILSTVPSAKGIFFDQEYMIPRARALLARVVGLERCSLVAGDMFSSVPGGGDVYVFCRVLAGWEDDLVVTAFRNCRHAVSTERAHLIVLDRFVQEQGGSELAALWDLHLMVTTGGRHRSLDEIRGLLQRGGFAIERVANLPMETVAVIAKLTD